MDMINESFEFRYELETSAHTVFKDVGSLLKKPGSNAATEGVGKRDSRTWSSWFLLTSEELVSSDTDDNSYRYAVHSLFCSA